MNFAFTEMDQRSFTHEIEIEDLLIYRFVVGPVANNVYIVRSKSTGESVLIDAANEHEKLLEVAQDLGVKLVLETHGHWDHIGAVSEVRDAGYEVYVAKEDAKLLPSYDQLLNHEEVIEVGGLRIKQIWTPGHTPGSYSFAVEGYPVLFTGDTLFPGGPGTTALEGGDFSAIIRSIEEEIFSKFAGETVILPGHGESSTIANEAPNLQSWIDRGW